MEETYTDGIAFVCEGDTEKVFYLALLEHFCKKHEGADLHNVINQRNGEVEYILTHGKKRVLIKFNVVGTISQITNCAAWLRQRCFHAHKSLHWTVFLCYDTDDYLSDITKFYEGDWKDLRNRLQKNGNCSIVDLATQADIEDTMLLDADGVYRYLGIPSMPIPNGAKGKRKMQKIFRSKGSGCAYHAGVRAEPLIRALDLDKIIVLSPMPLAKIEKACFDATGR